MLIRGYTAKYIIPRTHIKVWFVWVNPSTSDYKYGRPSLIYAEGKGNC